MKLQSVILDVDGTLVLSNDAHAQAWVEAFAASGCDIRFDQVRPLIGMGGDRLIPMLVPGLSDESDRGKAISSRRKELILNHYGPTLSPTPGARQLILRLQQAGLQLIIASSATSEELAVLLKAAQIEDLLKEAVTSSDVEASKPAPDVVAVALSRLSLPADRVAMLGDTPYDIESAAQCNVNVVALRCGGFSDDVLAGAIAIYDHPSDLVANYANSVFGS